MGERSSTEAEIRAVARTLCGIQGIDPDAQKVPGNGGWVKFNGFQFSIGPYAWELRRPDAVTILKAKESARAAIARASQAPGETEG